MKILLLLFISFIFSFQSFGQYTQIPDPNFEQALIDLGHDTGDVDGKILTTTVAQVTSLFLYEKQISDLTGIEAFTSLTDLSCSNNELSNLDLSNNVKLKSLFVQDNRSPNFSIDILKNINLELLACNDANLNQLNLSNNLALKTLQCGGNKMSNLDVTKNINLTSLNCTNNFLYQLDITNNIHLANLYCGDNNILNLNLSKNLLLKTLFCGGNTINILDVTLNTQLNWLMCGSNNLSLLDVSTNILLKKLSCDWNKLSQLDLSNNNQLKGLNCAQNQIISLDLTKNDSLEELFCYRNRLECLNIGTCKGNAKNINLYAWDNPNLTCIDIRNRKIDQFSALELDSNVTLSQNCFKACSSPLDTTDLTSANISIYPNPTNGNLTISFNDEVVEHVEAVLINAIGQEIKYYEFNLVSEFSIEISQSSGVYYLQLIADSYNPIIYKVLKH